MDTAGATILLLSFMNCIKRSLIKEYLQENNMAQKMAMNLRLKI